MRLKTRRVYIISEFTELAVVASPRMYANRLENVVAIDRSSVYVNATRGTRDCGCNVSTALHRFYVRRRKNYTFTSEIISLSEWFATRLNRNSASIKWFRAVRAGTVHLQFVVTQHEASRLRVGPARRTCIYTVYTLVHMYMYIHQGVYKAFSSLSHTSRFRQQHHGKRVCNAT